MLSSGLGFLGVVAAAAATTPSPPDRCRAPASIEARTLRLDHGLHVIIVPDPLARDVSVELLVGVGSRSDSVNLGGVAHLAEHVCAGRAYGRDLTADLGRRAATIQAVTSLDETLYMFSGPRGTLPLLLWAASGCLFQWKPLAAAGLEQEREAVLIEARGRLDASATTVDILSRLGLRSEDRAETAASIADITTDQVADHLAQWYRPGAVAVRIGGPVDAREAAALAQHWLGQPAAPPVKLRPPPEASPLHKPHRIEARATAPPGQVTVSFVLPGILSPAWGAVVVLEDLLRNELRLEHDLVQRDKLATSVEVALDLHARATILSVSATPTATAAFDTLAHRLATSMRAVDTGLHDEMLHRAQRRIQLRRATALLKTSDTWHCQLRDALWGHSPCQSLDPVTAKDLRRLLRKWVHPGWVEIVVRPAGQQDDAR